MIPIIAAVVSAIATVAVALLTYVLTKRREQEAEWRKLRLERYQQYLAAFSAVVRTKPTSDDRERYADAANNLSLMAPPTVLRALYRFQDAVSRLGEGIPQAEAEEAASALLHAMRADVQPAGEIPISSLTIRFHSPGK